MARFDSNVAIRIGADFVGLPAFKKADTAVDKLYKGTKKLAGAFGLAFSAQAIARYSASAVRAFAAEERQIQQLTNTVQNLGLAFAAPEVNDYIENMERLTGITRDQLQPAFQKLLTQTGSITKSQKILSAAIEVSFSGLMSVEQAATALTQAYVGNVKGLRQLNLGLSSAELSAMSFEQILQKVSDTYNGQFKTALNSTEVKFNKIRVAADNAKESVGAGLVKAFSDLAGNGDIEKSTSLMEKFGEVAGRIIGNLFTPTKVGSFYLPIPALLRKEPQTNTIGSPASWREKNVALAKAEAKAAANAKKIEDAKLSTLRKQTAEKRAQAAVDKANKALSAASAMFDPQGIQIAAALQGNITDEQRKRLELMQKIWELEQALQQENTALIEKLTAQLLELTKQTEQLNKNFQALEKINDILDKLGYSRKLFDLDNINTALDLLNRMTGSTYTVQNFAATVPQDLYKPLLIDFANAAAEEVVVPEVNITIDGNVSGLIDVVVDGLQQKSASGVDTRITRNTGGFNW